MPPPWRLSRKRNNNVVVKEYTSEQLDYIDEEVCDGK